MLISIIGVIVVLGVMILSHELGHFLMAKRMGVKVEIFSLGLGPKLWSVKKGETEYVLSAVPFGGYVKMAGEEPGDKRTGAEWEFYSKPVHKRFAIVIGGAAVNYILGFMLLCLVFMLGVPVPTSRIGRILEGYPAEVAGLKANDKIIKIDGVNVKHWDEVTEAIHTKGETAIDIVVERDGELITFNITGRSEEQKDIFGKATKKVTLIGIGFSDEVDYVKYGFFKAIEMGGSRTWQITALTYRGIWYMLTGRVSLNAAAGPIGIFTITGQAARMGIIPLLSISALISISLAIINLLPVPALDGGHVLFLIIEKLKGRPLDVKVQEAAYHVGWILLITLLLFLSWNDIIHFKGRF